MLNMNRGWRSAAVLVTSLTGLVFNAASLPEGLQQITQATQNFAPDQRFVVFFADELQTGLIDSQLTSSMQLVEPLDFRSRTFGVANLDATWKCVTIKNVSSMPERFANHERQSIMTHRPPYDAGALVEGAQVRDAAMDAQILRRFSDGAALQTDQFKQDFREAARYLQDPVEAIEKPDVYGRHMNQNREDLWQRLRRLGYCRRGQRYLLAWQSKILHFPHHPFRFRPVADLFPYPRIGPAESNKSPFIQGVAPRPVHDDSLFLQALGGPEEFARGYAPTDLICDIASSKVPGKGCVVADSLIGVIPEIPPVPGHQLGEHLSKVGKTMDKYAPPGWPFESRTLHRFALFVEGSGTGWTNRYPPPPQRIALARPRGSAAARFAVPRHSGRSANRRRCT